jgi:TonB family protein
MFEILLAVGLVQAASQSPVEDPWPTTPAGLILASPDWSDYRIYPDAAVAKQQEGRVVPELLIGSDGTPRACRIVVSSKFAELDAGTCDLMMKMRFEPARDSSGAAVPSHYERAVIWGLTDPRPFASSAIRARVTIAAGKAQSCQLIGGEGPYVAFWSAFACTVFSDAAYYFAERSRDSLTALIEVRLDAGDDAPFLKTPWSSGSELAHEKIRFTVDSEGDPASCAPVESHGFGRRGLNNLSPCGRLLSGLWFADAPNATAARNGIFETRVMLLQPQR